MDSPIHCCFVYSVSGSTVPLMRSAMMSVPMTSSQVWYKGGEQRSSAGRDGGSGLQYGGEAVVVELGWEADEMK